MRKGTIGVLDKVKVQILDAVSWLSIEERIELYSELHEWSFRQLKLHFEAKQTSFREE